MHDSSKKKPTQLKRSVYFLFTGPSLAFASSINSVCYFGL